MRIENGGLRALGLAVALTTSTMAVPALAAPAPAASQAEHQKLADDLSSLIFDMVDFRAVMAQAVSGADLGAEFGETRPEWPRMIETAIVEEIEQDMPKIKRMAAIQFAKHFTAEELRAGLQVFKDPAVKAAFEAGAAGREAPKGLEPSRATIKLMETPAGRRFIEKLGSIDTIMKPLESEFMAEVFPGAMRRFADKAEAAEATRVQ